MKKKNSNEVKVYEEEIEIPTYEEPPAEEMPMFSENRVHQRTSGRPYPNRVVIGVNREAKIDKKYTGIRLENEYLSVCIIPELGGRIFSATDKKTGYDLFYRQHVIKPALIGILGSWISGGVEASTFMPVDYHIERGNGSVTVWLSEHDPISRMKGMVGIRLNSGEAIFETKVKLCNRTPVTRSFLWWENAAVPVNTDYQLIFPPDVSYVNFHYDRSVTTYPIAKGVYNGIRFGDGIDISMHRNTKYPTSYFSAPSKYDFFGGYDHGKGCGVLHIASHHISPGKKMFTWAYNQLSRSWENALTDSDGVYAELMAGCYSDNQPDFSWLEPFETKNFSQFWYPIGNIGSPVFANKDVALNIKRENQNTIFSLQATRSIKNARFILSNNKKILLDTSVNLFPSEPVRIKYENTQKNYKIVLKEYNGNKIIDFKEDKLKDTGIPDPNDDIPCPGKIKSAQDLYLAGVHLAQYHDPKTLPEPYWLEALKRDSEFIPVLLALGDFYYQKGFFQKSLGYLNKAKSLQTSYNPNPKEGTVFYLLGLVFLEINAIGRAYDCFHKATWNEACYSRSMTMIACIDGVRGDFSYMLEHSEAAIRNQKENPLAGVLAAAAENRLGLFDDSIERLESILKIDPLNHLARYLHISFSNQPIQSFYKNLKSSHSQTCLDLAFDLISSGLKTEAIKLLEGLLSENIKVSPMVLYTLGMLYDEDGQTEKAGELYKCAYKSEIICTFPFRLHELKVLRYVLNKNPEDDKALNLLGCLLYDKGHFDEASRCWEKCIKINDQLYMPYRNLAVAYYSHLNRKDESLPLLQKALSFKPGDKQLIFELSHVMKLAGISAKERIKFLKSNCSTTLRDDIYLELACAFNQAEKPIKALELLKTHTFVPCEGGEHAVAKQYMFAHYSLGRDMLKKGNFKNALYHFQKAQNLPDNLGAGLWNEVMLVPHQYYEAYCLEQLNRNDEANNIYSHIIALSVDYFSNVYLSSLPYYQACAMNRTNDNIKGKKLIKHYLDGWEKAQEEKDAGYFKTTPFFISYCEEAKYMRIAYYKYLTGLARLYLGKVEMAIKDFQESYSYDPSNLYCWLEYKLIGK